MWRVKWQFMWLWKNCVIGKNNMTRIVPFLWILNKSSYKMNTQKSHVRDGTTGLQKTTWHDFVPVDLSQTSIETRMTWFFIYWHYVFFGNHVISTWNTSVVKIGIMWCLRQVNGQEIMSCSFLQSRSSVAHIWFWFSVFTWFLSVM